MTSRDDQYILCQLQDYPNLETESSRNQVDIMSYIRATTQDLIKRRKLLRFSSEREELPEIINNQVTDGAKGNVSHYAMAPVSIFASSLI